MPRKSFVKAEGDNTALTDKIKAELQRVARLGTSPQVQGEGKRWASVANLPLDEIISVSGIAHRGGCYTIVLGLYPDKTMDCEGKDSDGKAYYEAYKDFGNRLHGQLGKHGTFTVRDIEKESSYRICDRVIISARSMEDLAKGINAACKDTGKEIKRRLWNIKVLEAGGGAGYNSNYQMGGN